MIILLSTARHRYTHYNLLFAPRLKLRIMCYEQCWRTPTLPRATYVFTDVERMGYWELELAARLFRVLKRAGCRVLNDPARALSRVGLLQQFQRAGVNSFGAWRLTERPEELPFPVFLRTNSSHRGVLGDLLYDRQSLETAIARHVADGYPARELIIVEYRAEPVREGLFHKRSMFRLGDVMVPSLGVFDPHWCAKRGKRGIAGEALYERERRALARLEDAPQIEHAFDVAGLEYGRADYSVAAGRIEIYEINTNPQVPSTVDHPFASRREAGRHAREALRDAFRALSQTYAGSAEVALDDEVLTKQRRRDRWAFGARWRP